MHASTSGAREWLRGQGYDALHLRDDDLQQLPDEDVFAKAASEGRIILTIDLDFRRDPESLPGGAGEHDRLPRP